MRESLDEHTQALDATRTLKSYIPTPLKRWIKTTIQGRDIPQVARIRSVFPDLKRTTVLPSYTVKTPLLETSDLWDSVSGLAGPTYTSPPGIVDEVTGGYYCTTNRVLLGPDREIIAESLSTRIGSNPPTQPHYPFDGTYVFGTNIIHVDGLSTSFQFHRRNYYHTLVDALPRLHLLERLQTEQQNQPVKIICSELNRTERHYLDRLRPAGTEVVEVPPNCIVRTERFLHLSFLSRQSVGFLPSPYLRSFRERTLPDRASAHDRRIFVTREIAGTRQIRNRDTICQRLANLGFERIELETLTSEEQIETFYDAETVVATHGASLANLLFTGPNTRVIELFPHPFLIPTYYLLSRALDIPYHALFSNQDDRYADFDVDVEALVNLVSAE